MTKNFVLLCTLAVCCSNIIKAQQQSGGNQFSHGADDTKPNSNNHDQRYGQSWYPQIQSGHVYIPGYTDSVNQNNPTYPMYPNPSGKSGSTGYPTGGAQLNTHIYSSPAQSPPMNGRSFKVTLMRGNVKTDEPLTQPQALYASVGFGTPPQQMNILFDTGSPEIWIPHYSPWSFFKKSLHYEKGYRGSDSSTSTKENTNYEMFYRGVKLEAKAYIDNLLFDYRASEHLPIGQLSNATAGSGIAEHEVHDSMVTDLVQQQRFLAVSDASDSTFRYAPFDGIIGLAPVVRSPTGTVPFLVRARETGTISHTVFSIYINPVLDSSFGGEITFGGVNPARYTGPIYFHPITSWFDWAVRLQSVQLGQQVVSCQHGCAAIFDTGLNDIIWGPSADVIKMMHSYLNAQWDQALNLYTIHCSRLAGLPQLVFVIDSSQYVLLPTNYVRLFKDPSTGAEKCYMTIRPRDTPNWVLGANFLGAYYTVFDMDQRRIGFATMNTS